MSAISSRDAIGDVRSARPTSDTCVAPGCLSSGPSAVESSRMAARVGRLVVVLTLGVVLPASAAAAVVRPPTSQETAIPPVPARGAGLANARSYFGARYCRADVGRFTTVDPVYTWSENLADPQRWNRYAYVRNNPLKYTDPTGMYLDGCGGVATKECSQAMDALEKERQRALSSGNKRLVEAASAYGSYGDDNHVVVTPDFGGLLAGANARTTGPEAPGGDAGVLLDPGGASLQRTIVHEGVHVGQMQGFVNSFDPVSGKYDKAQNPIVVLAELSAFQTGARVAPYWVGGTLGSLGPTDTVKILQYLTRTTPYRQTLNQRFFGIATWPQ